MASEMLFLMLIKGFEASVADVAVPVEAILRSPKLAIVLITPFSPLSKAWLFAVVKILNPAFFAASAN